MCYNQGYSWTYAFIHICVVVMVEGVRRRIVLCRLFNIVIANYIIAYC